MTLRRFRSFAKINLGLEVVGKLPSGYHELKTLFATISLHDLVDISETRGGVSVESDHEGVPPDETNLAHRAAVAMQRLSGRRKGVAIRIHKRIPVGGGLGGGSSDAATVLRALDRLWGLRLGAAGLVETAKSLGADVPYFLFGGPALGLGRGDDIRPLDLRLREKVLLIPGQGGLSTATVFKRFAATPGPAASRSRIDSFLRAVEPGRRSSGHGSLRALRNDLEGAAIRESEALAEVARRIRRVGRTTGAIQAAMSGSGSSFFLLLEDRAAADAAMSALRESGLAGLRCSFVSRRRYESRFEVIGPR